MDPSPDQRPLRHAVVGAGANVFSMHRPALDQETVELVAVVDVVEEKGRPVADDLGVPFFTSHQEMLAAVEPEVTVIIVPHPFHARIAVDALDAGSHVLVEKPIAVHVGEADRMIEAARRNDRLLAVNFQHRQRPDVAAAKKLIEGGELGKIQRVTMVEPWLRTGAYFRHAGWRGTWRGEGGGILMNQAPHGLDLLCHLVGRPSRLMAWTRTRYHEIQTEDTVSAMLEWPDGGQGSIYFSTTEAGPRRLEIAGSRGVVSLSQTGNRFQRFETDLFDHMANNPNPFAAPALVDAELALEGSDLSGHIAVYRDLHQAILEGGRPLCDGAAARDSLELANAMIFSSSQDRPVDLPLDREAYVALLEARIAHHA